MLEVTQTLGHTHTKQHLLTHGSLSQVCTKKQSLILNRCDMIWFLKHATWSGSCSAGTLRQRECKSERERRGHSTEDSVDLCIFWQGMRERMVRRAHSQTPHTLNLYTQLADDQILWSPLSSQHIPTTFPFCPPAPPTAFLTPPRSVMWDRAKPCNTKRLGIIHLLAPVTHSLAGREQFSTRTPTNFRCGRFVLMSRENSRPGSSRPSSLTYTQLGVFTSPEEKIIQRERETKENRRWFWDFVFMCRGFFWAGAQLFDFIIFSFYICATFNAVTLKVMYCNSLNNFYTENTEK